MLWLSIIFNYILCYCVSYLYYSVTCCDRRHDTACLFIRLHKCMYLRGIGNLYMHYENVLLSVWIRRGNIFGKASPVGIRPCFKKDRLATA